MQRTAVAPFMARSQLLAGTWLARRWYYTPRSRRAYSVRQIAPGDRRLLAEFVVTLSREAAERDRAGMQELTDLLFDHVLGGDTPESAGYAALENTAAGDRVIGVCACTAQSDDAAEFRVAVAASHREEQIGRNLLSTLLRHVRRIYQPQSHGPTVSVTVPIVSARASEPNVPVRKPLHLIWGDSDKVVPVGIAEAWQQALPQARLSVIERSGHLPQLEHPQATADKIRSFIKEVDT